MTTYERLMNARANYIHVLQKEHLVSKSFADQDIYQAELNNAKRELEIATKNYEMEVEEEMER